MPNYYGGLAQVAHSDTLGGARTALTGKISVESSINPDNVKTDTADGGQLYAGSSVAPEIFFLNMADYQTVKGFMINNTEKFWHFIFKDGHELSTQEAVNPFVKPGDGVNVRDGIVAWIMDFERFSHEPVVEPTDAV